MTKEMQKMPGVRRGKEQPTNTLIAGSKKEHLKQVGLSEVDASRAEAVAAIPEESSSRARRLSRNPDLPRPK